MTDVTKTSETTVRLDKADLKTITIYCSSYAKNFSLTTRDADNINIKFADNTDLTSFMDAVINTFITAYEKIIIDEAYVTEYTQVGLSSITMQDVIKWRAAWADRPEDEQI